MSEPGRTSDGDAVPVDAAELVGAVQQIVRTHAPTMSFAEPESASALCGQSGRLTITLLRGSEPVPPGRWPAVEAEVWALLRAHGYTQRAVVLDDGVTHDVAYGRPGGGRVALGSSARFACTIETGCLPAG